MARTFLHIMLLSLALAAWMTIVMAALDENILNLTTFNTYQIAIAPNKEATREAQFEVIREEYADITDVYCLHELFYPNDIELYKNEFADIFPFSYSEVDEWDESETGLPQVSCPTVLVQELQAIQSTVSQCFEQCEADFAHQIMGSLQMVNCIIAECLIPIRDVVQIQMTESDDSNAADASFSVLEFLRQFQRSSCLHCLGVSFLEIQSNADLSWDHMLTQCMTPLDYNYQPTSGLLLLSKYPLLNQRMISLPSSVDFPRAVIMADVHVDDVLNKTVTIACTHPQAPYPNKTRKDSLYPFVGFDEVIINLELSTFTELTALQMLLTGHHIMHREKMQNFILMGDFNVGPNFVSQIYGRFMDYTSMQNIFSAEEMDEIGCTWCHDNSFNENVDEEEQLIDHIVFQSIYHVIVVNDKYRCYDELKTYSGGDELIEAHISDHYGICSSIQFYVPV